MWAFWPQIRPLTRLIYVLGWLPWWSREHHITAAIGGRWSGRWGRTWRCWGWCGGSRGRPGRTTPSTRGRTSSTTASWTTPPRSTSSCSEPTPTPPGSSTRSSFLSSHFGSSFLPRLTFSLLVSVLRGSVGRWQAEGDLLRLRQAKRQTVAPQMFAVIPKRVIVLNDLITFDAFNWCKHVHGNRSILVVVQEEKLVTIKALVA